jgi:hypothetical protein
MSELHEKRFAKDIYGHDGLWSLANRPKSCGAFNLCLTNSNNNGAVTSRFNCFAGKLGFNKTSPTQVCRSYNGPEIET